MWKLCQFDLELRRHHWNTTSLWVHVKCETNRNEIHRNEAKFTSFCFGKFRFDSMNFVSIYFVSFRILQVPIYWGNYTGLCIYISKIKKKCENCEIINVLFFFNVKCFLKSVWGYPYWKPHNFFLLKIFPVFSHSE